MKRPHIRLTYEPTVHVAYVHFVDHTSRRGAIARSEWALGRNVLVDLDERGRILGIEILDTRAVLRRETLDSADESDAAERILPKAA
ncbi:MAG TPA: DUF2283 domain-containing protein [Polyangiaceae bacterium]